MAYVLLNRLRSTPPAGTKMAQATRHGASQTRHGASPTHHGASPTHHGASPTCGTIRIRLFKLTAALKITVRRVVVHLPTACPFQEIFLKAEEALHRLRRLA